MPRVRDDIERLGARGLTWVDYGAAVADALATVIPFDAYCCHTVDPGTILFTGSVNRNVGCSGSWLAHHEYVIEDVNKWSFLAHSGRIAGATSIDTHGDLSRSTRHRSQEAYGFGDELRVSFVVDGIYWGAAAFLRRADEPWFTEAEVRTLVSVGPADRGRAAPLHAGARRPRRTPEDPVDHGPGVVVFDEHGEPESISAAAERWIERARRGPAAEHAERVEDGAGGRRPSPLHRARHRPAGAGGPGQGPHPLRHLAAAVRHPAERGLRRTDRGDHPSGHAPGRRTGDRPRPTA